MGSDLFNLRAKRADANGDYELTIVWEGGRGWDKGKDRVVWVVWVGSQVQWGRVGTKLCTLAKGWQGLPGGWEEMPRGWEAMQPG